MDDVDRRLLNMIQKEFPLCERPFEVIGEALGIAAEEAFSRVRRMTESGIIRRIGPSFDSGKLGHVSTLVAAKVPPEKLEEAAAVVSSYPEVTHNYARDFDYNLWFTIICESEKRLEAIIEEIKSKTGIADIRSLPAERTFKIRVDFEF